MPACMFVCMYVTESELTKSTKWTVSLLGRHWGECEHEYAGIGDQKV